MKKTVTPVPITEAIMQPTCPEFEALRELQTTAQQTRDRMGEVVGYVAKLETDVADASKAYYRNPSVETFKSFADASAQLTAAKAAQAGLTFSNLPNAYQQEPESVKVLLAALRVARDRLAKRISALNDEERERLLSAGVDPEGAEHPAIGKLKAHLSELAGRIIYAEEWLSNSAPSNFQWTGAAQLLKL